MGWGWSNLPDAWAVGSEGQEEWFQEALLGGCEVVADAYSPGAWCSGGGDGGYKNALSKLLKNPNCAKWLGGGAMAASVLNGLGRVVNAAPDSGFSPSNSTEIMAANQVNSGFLADNTAMPAPNGSWNGRPYSVFVGEDFNSQTFGAQLTVLLHEMMHAAWMGTPMAGAVDLVAGGEASAGWLSRDCGTDFPQYGPWQQETTSQPIATTLQ